MGFTLTKARKKDGLDVFALQGHLTIQHSAALRKSIVEQLVVQQQVLLHVREVNDVDITALQLLLALIHQPQGQNYSVKVQMELSAEQECLLQHAGITSSIFDIP